MRFTPAHSNSNRLAMNMTSLIDITFLLLIYFMVSAVMSQPENRLTPSIRTQDEAASGVAADFQPQIIEQLPEPSESQCIDALTYLTLEAAISPYSKSLRLFD